ncbi:MAG: VanZ family protein [Lachnospiraceae bacterium]|nr:VanZ family protein [Lachnospiraceae bacterium]
MRIREVLEVFRSEIFFVLLFIFGIAAAFFLGYGFLYRKIFRGEKRIHGRDLFFGVLTTGYMGIVLGATILRPSVFGGRIELMPFASYQEALRSFDMRSWRYLFLNICMFVPLGFLLPVWLTWFRNFFRTCLAGFLFSFGIEVCQYFFHRGVCETDDVMNNLFGTMIGYGFYKIVSEVLRFFYHKKRGEKERGTDIRTVLLCQIPLLIVAGFFAGSFLRYSQKELGNLTWLQREGYDLSGTKVECMAELSKERSEQMVYQEKWYKEAETKKLAEDFFEKLGMEIDENLTIVQDESIVYYSEGKDPACLWVEQRGGRLWYTAAGALACSEDEDTELKPLSEDFVREAVQRLGFHLPESITPQVQRKGKEWQYSFEADGIIEDHTLYAGNCSCTFDGEGELLEYHNYISVCQEYKKFSVISEKEAYEKLCDGEFVVRETDMEDLGTGDSKELQIQRVSVNYQEDSKGFLQPVYLFEGTVGGKKVHVMVAAVL